MAQAIQPQHLDLAEYDIRQRWRTRPPKQFPSDWATSWGFDKYGLWQTFEVPAGKSGGNYGADNEKVRHKMRFIPSGSFLMGAPRNEDQRNDNRPQHNVMISKGFWLGETAVPQILWTNIVMANPSHFRDRNNPMLPVENVSWYECRRFCEALGQKIEALCDLPTEAQWEYSCRAGTNTQFNVGTELETWQANINSELGKTTDVDKFQPNGWGLKQMHGNVWEWCLDKPRQYSSKARSDPMGPMQEEQAGLRGGSWYLNSFYCRSAYRSIVRRDYHYYSIGLRIAITD